MTNNNWDESKHPRDNVGKFTFKGLGETSSEPSEEKMQKRADTLYGDDEEYYRKYPKKNSNETDVVLTGGAANMENTKENNHNNSEQIFENSLDNKNNNLPDAFWSAYNNYKGIEDPANTIWYTLGAFVTNWLEMKDAETKKADKYFHARANYEAAQQGMVGELATKIISDLREYSDNYRNIKEKGYTQEYSQQDIKEDQEANEEGRKLGRENPTTPAFKKLKHRMPKGFPERYQNR